MKEYTYLSDHKKANSVSLGLLLASALLGVINLFVNNGILNCLANVLAVVMFGFAMHYLDYNNVQGQSIKKYIVAFHCFAIHAILPIFSSITGQPGTLSYQVLHGLTDMMLVAGLLALAKIFKPSLSYMLVVLVSLVGFVLSLLNVNLVFNILVAVLGLLVIFFAYKSSISSVVLGLVVALLALTAIFTKNNPLMHKYLHVLAMIAMMYVAYKFYDIIKARSENVVRGLDIDTPSTSSTSTRSAMPTYTSLSYEPDDSWFIKEYQNLSYEDKLNAPVNAFKGVSEEMAKDLKAAFNIKTIKDLAESKYFIWAKEIVEEAER